MAWSQHLYILHSTAAKWRNLVYILLVNLQIDLNDGI